MKIRKTIFGASKYHYFAIPEYQAVLDKANSLGYQLPPKKTQKAQNTFLKNLIDNGIWNKLDEMHVWAGLITNNLNFSTINLRNPNFLLTHFGGTYSLSKKGYNNNHDAGGPTTDTRHFIGNFNNETEPTAKFKLGNASIISSWYEFGEDGSGTPVKSQGSNEVYIREQVYRHYFQQGGGYNQRSNIGSMITPNQLRVISRSATLLNIWFGSSKVINNQSISYLGSGAPSPSTGVNYKLDYYAGNSNIKTLQIAAKGSILNDTEVANFNNAWNNYINSL